MAEETPKLGNVIAPDSAWVAKVSEPAWRSSLRSRKRSPGAAS
jgi:hypothetical protein